MAMTTTFRNLPCSALMALVLGVACGDEDVDSPTDKEEGADTAAAGAPCSNPDGDDDGDGLSNAAEARVGTDCTNPDTDEDGVSDFDELLDDGGDTGGAPLDTDGDGIPDELERAEGTAPDNPDTDGDGASDGLERDAGTSPIVVDTDGDGLDDYAEILGATDPRDPDSDGDGLTDGEETNPPEGRSASDPLVADTDGDGVDDGAEAIAGTDPLDPASRPSLVGVNDLVECVRGEEDQAEFWASTQYYEDGTYNPAWGDSLGTVCHCSFRLTDPTPSLVTGLSLFLPTQAHADSEWWPGAGDDEARPLAVRVLAPWDTSGVGFYAEVGDPTAGVEFGAERWYDDPSGLSPNTNHWHAFNASPLAADGASDATLRSRAGTYDVWIAFRNPPGGDIEECSRLSADTSVTTDPLYRASRLRLRVDDIRLALARPALGTVGGDPLACVPGQRRVSRFALAGLGRAPAALWVGGEGRYAWSSVSAVRLLDAGGARSVRMQSPRQGVVEVLPGTRRLDAGPLHALGWSIEGRGPTAPVIEVEHVCPSMGPSVPSTVAAGAVPWSTLDGLARSIAGRGAAALLGLPGPSADGALRVELLRAEGHAAVVIRAHGGVALRTIAATVTGAAWRFDHRERGLRVVGSVVQEATGLRIEFSEITLDGRPVGALPAPVRVPAASGVVHAVR